MIHRNVTFDAARDFFVIDSFNYKDALRKLYGYAVIDDAILQDTPLNGDDLSQQMGAYVFVDRDEKGVHIRQDFMGSYGLCLYRNGDYFAIGNSFVYLVKYLKASASEPMLTINKEYADLFMVADTCSSSFSETLCEEIELLPRNAEVLIDFETGKLGIEYIDNLEYTVELDSEEGVALLDEWHDKWVDIITSNVSDIESPSSGHVSRPVVVDVSGGFDSRVVLSLFLDAPIERNKIRFNSIHDGLHTHNEDYSIASRIAEEFGIAITNTHELWDISNLIDEAYYDRGSMLDISLYLKLGFHKQMYFQKGFGCVGNEVLYYTGGGGECLRGYWDFPQEGFYKKLKSGIEAMELDPEVAITDAVKDISERSFDALRKHYEDLGHPLEECHIGLWLFRETYCRHHFGKLAIENLYGSKICMSPLLDPMLYRLKCASNYCDDLDLLFTLILDRYVPDLTTIPFDGGRTISDATLSYAKAINERFPYHSQKDEIGCRVKNGRGGLLSQSGNAFDKSIIDCNHEIDEYLKDAFCSLPMERFITKQYSFASFLRIEQDIDTRTYYPLLRAYPAFSYYWASYVLESKEDEVESPACMIKRLCESPRSFNINRVQLHPSIRDYVTARVDIKNNIPDSDDIEGLHIRLIGVGESTTVTEPSWFATGNNKGFIVESQNGAMSITAICEHKGTLDVVLKGRDVRTADGSKAAVWVDFTSMEVNGEEVLSGRTSVWHDAPYKYSMDVDAGDVIFLSFRWLPCDLRNVQLHPICK